MAKDIIYLACPYTHPDPVIRLQRYEAATMAAATLIKKGLIVFSPLTMTHPIDVLLAGSGSTLGSQYWVDFDEAFMNFCSQMLVLTVEGWEASSGIKREMDFFRAAGKPVHFVAPEEIDIVSSVKT